MKKIIVFLLLMVAFYFSSTLNPASATYNCHVSGTSGGDNGRKCNYSACGGTSSTGPCRNTERVVYLITNDNPPTFDGCCSSQVSAVCETFANCSITPTPTYVPGETWHCNDFNCMGVACSTGTRCAGSYPNPCECVSTNPRNTPIPTRTPTPTGPSPTINPNCQCASDVCSADCSFDYNSQVTSYTKSPKCSLSSSLFSTPPTDLQKRGWCKSLRVRGDADGNGVVDAFLDYLYYVTVVSGGKIPQNVNPDFNGDGEVRKADLDIWKLTMGIPL